MCEFCRKVAIIKEIVTTYFTDEELQDMAKTMKAPISDEPDAARAAIALIAAVEIALDYGVSPPQIFESINIGITRTLMRDIYNATHGEGD